MTNNSTIPKPIPAVACESHNSSRKQPYAAKKALSESEINDVIQLVKLSSSADSYSDQHTDQHQEDDNSSNSSFSFSFSKSIDAASSSYSSSSSVATVLLTEAEKGELAQEDHNDHGGGDDRSNFGARRNKRYRSIIELYKVTDETMLKKKNVLMRNDHDRSFKFLEEID